MSRSCVLLIEPDHVLGKVYMQAIEQAGHGVMWAKSAQQAIVAADQQVPDLVILELQLPGHGGVEFLYEFRSYPEWQQVPVVLHTMVMHHAVNFFEPLLVTGYYYKPATSLRQLIRAINTALPVSA